MCKILFYFACCFACAHAADEFLTKLDAGASFLSDLEAKLGENNVATRMIKLQHIASPMWKSLPKRTGEMVSPTVARYALHRLVVSQHGWTMNGATTGVDFGNTNDTLATYMHELLPGHVAEVIDKHLTSDAISFEDLTTAVALFEHFVREDARSLLRTVLERYNLPTVAPLAPESFLLAIDVYVSLFFGYTEVEELGAKFRTLRQALRYGERVFPGWKDTTTFVRDSYGTLQYSERDTTNPFIGVEAKTDMSMALRVVDLISDGLSRVIQQPICAEMTDDLSTHEQANTGRVALADFYRATFDARFFYVETREYLRDVGAIDETDTTVGPKVIIPNYVQLPGNCIGQDHVFAICCKSECEDLFGSLERKLQTPAAPADQILSVVSSMSSSTVQAPRNLSQQLVARLFDIGVAQGGEVILHSRLFSQWMHSAFPHECPYPHLAGAKYALSISIATWEREKDRAHRVDDKGTKNRVEKLTEAIATLQEEFSPVPLAGNESFEVDALWTDHDDHFVEPAGPFLLNRMAVVLGLPCVLLASIVGFVTAKQATDKGNHKTHGITAMFSSTGASVAGSYFV